MKINIIVVAFFLLCISASSQTSKDAEMLLERALEGDATAQTNLGLKYARGDGVKQNYNQAHSWWIKAAAQGEAAAQYNLANMLKKGQGPAKDIIESLKWLRKSAEQGYAPAQNELGRSYYDGQVVRQNHAEAVGWFRKAAQQGDIKAQNNLGLMYANGFGVRTDYVRALMWWNLSVEGGNQNTARNRPALVKVMTKEQVAQAQALASDWSLKRAREDEKSRTIYADNISIPGFSKYTNTTSEYTFSILFPTLTPSIHHIPSQGLNINIYQAPRVIDADNEEFVQYSVSIDIFTGKKILSDEAIRAFLEESVRAKIATVGGTALRMVFSKFKDNPAVTYQYTSSIEGLEFFTQGINFILDGDAVGLTVNYSDKTPTSKVHFDQYVNSFSISLSQAR